ncbi:MAG: hypothetical protein ACXABY_37210 [Candidatus Thorarchaeota archaeon]|jgi:hypothetical protein
MKAWITKGHITDFKPLMYVKPQGQIQQRCNELRPHLNLEHDGVSVSIGLMDREQLNKVQQIIGDEK